MESKLSTQLDWTGPRLIIMLWESCVSYENRGYVVEVLGMSD